MRYIDAYRNIFEMEMQWDAYDIVCICVYTYMC